MDYIKKNWLKILIATIVVIIIVRVLRSISDNSKVDNQVKVTKKPRFVCDESKPLNRDKVLRKGTKDSNEVCYLQNWLNQYFNSGLTVDGNFGSKTEKALISAKNGAYGSLNFFGA